MNGNKTYAVAALMILHALSAYALGHDQTLNLQEILAALGLSALRAGVKKAERPESLPPGMRALLFLCAIALLPLGGTARAATNTQHATRNTLPAPHLTGANRDNREPEKPPFPPLSPVQNREPEIASRQSAIGYSSGLYYDSFISARTPNFSDATYSYGLGIGYQVSPVWSADLRASHSGFDTRGSVVQDLGGRLVARMPFEFLAPYTFLGASFDLERDRWLIQPGAGIEFGVNKRLRGLSLFAEGGLDADLHGRNGYVFNGGVRLRF